MVLRQPLTPERRPRPPDRKIAQEAEPLDRLPHRAGDLDELLPRGLHPRERDEAAEDLVRPFEDEVRTGVAEHPFVRLVTQVADPRRDLQRLVGHPPERLGAEHFADRTLDGVIADVLVDEAGRQVRGALERVRIGQHRRESCP